MKKNDFIVIGILCIIVISISSYFFLSNKTSNEDKYISIQINGNEVKKFPYNSKDLNWSYQIKTPQGINTIIMTKKGIAMKEADCPDQTCVHMSPISEVGEMIICLPHKLVIEIKSTDQLEGLDMVVN